MGQGQSAAQELHKKKKEELAQMMKVLDAKRTQFLAEIILKRGKDISDKEVSGGRSVVRQSAIRVATQASPSQQIKKAIGTFFEANQGGNKGKKAIVKGASQLVTGAIDAIFGVSKGAGMEKRGFIVLFLNFAFVRTDYFVYSYCAHGEKWGCQNSVSGSVQVTDMAVLDPATLHPMEIDYLIAQNITLDSGDETKPMENPEFEALMQIKVMLATSAVLTRIMQDPKTDFKTLKVTMDQIRQIMDALAGKIGELPEFDEEETEKMLAVTTENWFLIKNEKRDDIKDAGTKTLTKLISNKVAAKVVQFIEGTLPAMDPVSEENKYGYKITKSTTAGGDVEKITAKKIETFGLGLKRDEWDEPDKLIGKVGAKFLVDNKDYDATEDTSAKYLPITDSATDAEKKDRAIVIKQQLMAQFRRSTYDEVAQKYVRYHELTDCQKAGISVLFGFDEAEWDTYYPSYKAPGRDETVFDDRDLEVAWETW